jgi:hypothetical protein
MKKIKYVLLILFTIIFLLIIPLRGIYRTEVSNNKPGHEMSIPSMSYGYQISQELCPSGDYIDSLLLWISSLNCETNQGYLSIHLLDSNLTSVYENNIPLSELPTYGWFEAVSGVEVTAGNTYYLTAETCDAVDDGPMISYFRDDNAESCEEEGGQLTYAYLPLDECTLKLRIIYNNGLFRYEYVVYYVFILFIASFVVNKKIRN